MRQETKDDILALAPWVCLPIAGAELFLFGWLCLDGAIGYVARFIGMTAVMFAFIVILSDTVFMHNIIGESKDDEGQKHQ